MFYKFNKCWINNLNKQVVCIFLLSHCIFIFIVQSRNYEFELWVCLGQWRYHWNCRRGHAQHDHLWLKESEESVQLKETGEYYGCSGDIFEIGGLDFITFFLPLFKDIQFQDLARSKVSSTWCQECLYLGPCGTEANDWRDCNPVSLAGQRWFNDK